MYDVNIGSDGRMKTCAQFVYYSVVLISGTSDFDLPYNVMYCHRFYYTPRQIWYPISDHLNEHWMEAMTEYQPL